MNSLQLYHKPRRRKRIGPEACLQYAVVQYLLLSAPRGTIWFHPANEGKRTEGEGAHLKRMGMLPGVADLCIILPGEKARFLELKARGEKQSDDQIAFQALCESNGTPYAVADNIDQALRILTGWGALAGKLRRAA
jgi:hypothetical protein